MEDKGEEMEDRGEGREGGGERTKDAIILGLLLAVHNVAARVQSIRIKYSSDLVSV